MELSVRRPSQSAVPHATDPGAEATSNVHHALPPADEGCQHGSHSSAASSAPSRYCSHRNHRDRRHVSDDATVPCCIPKVASGATVEPTMQLTIVGCQLGWSKFCRNCRAASCLPRPCLCRCWERTRDPNRQLHQRMVHPEERPGHRHCYCWRWCRWSCHAFDPAGITEQSRLPLGKLDGRKPQTHMLIRIQTLRIVAAIIVGLSAPLLFLVKPRLPVFAARISPPVDISFLRHRLFWILQVFNIVQALGYFLPLNYLPSIAEAAGLSSTLGSITILLVNTGLVPGCVVVGALVDRFDVTAVTSAVSALAAVAVFVALGLSVLIVPLYIFSTLYRLTASTYSTNWGGVIKEIQKQHDRTDASLVFGLLAAGRGIGSIVSGPLSEALLANSATGQTAASSAYETQYSPVIIFAGTTAAIGGCSC
nr:hypothetical protein CFP56_25966 [Quercus suber]